MAVDISEVRCQQEHGIGNSIQDGLTLFLASSCRLCRPVTFDRDSGDVCGNFRHALFIWSWSSRDAVVHGERAGHLTGTRADWTRPACAKSVLHSQHAEIVPKTILVDIGHDDSLIQVSSRAA